MFAGISLAQDPVQSPANTFVTQYNAFIIGKTGLDTLLSPIRALSADGRKNILVWCLPKFYRHTRELPILLQRLLTQFVRSNESGSTSPWHPKNTILFQESNLQNKKVFHYEEAFLFCEPFADTHPSAAAVWANCFDCCSCWPHFCCQQLLSLPPRFIPRRQK